MLNSAVLVINILWFKSNYSIPSYSELGKSFVQCCDVRVLCLILSRGIPGTFDCREPWPRRPDCGIGADGTDRLRADRYDLKIASPATVEIATGVASKGTFFATVAEAASAAVSVWKCVLNGAATANSCCTPASAVVVVDRAGARVERAGVTSPRRKQSIPTARVEYQGPARTHHQASAGWKGAWQC